LFIRVASSCIKVSARELAKVKENWKSMATRRKGGGMRDELKKESIRATNYEEVLKG
jgi:hypothetical protein